MVNRIKKKLHYKENKLFWVTTDDHDEDWFVIARDEKTAYRFHEAYEGYDRGDAKAKEIQKINRVYRRRKVYHAQVNMLEDMGFEIMSEKPSRVVFKDGKIFKEKTTVEDVMKENAIGKEGLYVLRVAGSDLFKIGITKNLQKRFINMQTGNPLPMEIYAFYPTKNHKGLERSLHKLFRHKSMGENGLD